MMEPAFQLDDITRPLGKLDKNPHNSATAGIATIIILPVLSM